jgi:hypothetical protein
MTVGLGRYLRRSVAAPIVKQLDMHGELLFEAHLQRLLSADPYSAPKRLERYGFRSFSQNDEDGILQEIFRRVGTAGRTFVEFGVQEGLQNNTRLLLYQGWRGLWIEADRIACRSMRDVFATELAAGRLQLLHSFVTAENIAALIDSAQLGELDLLSIDIDGNDYWIWDALALQPRVIAIEYNAKLRPPVKWVMEYNPDHRWNHTDYHGASLESLNTLARRKGYTLVGCSLSGVNAFFVRDDLVLDRFEVPDVASLYNPPRYYMQRFLSAGHPAGPFGPYQSV